MVCLWGHLCTKLFWCWADIIKDSGRFVLLHGSFFLIKDFAKSVSFSTQQNRSHSAFFKLPHLLPARWQTSTASCRCSAFTSSRLILRTVRTNEAAETWNVEKILICKKVDYTWSPLFDSFMSKYHWTKLLMSRLAKLQAHNNTVDRWVGMARSCLMFAPISHTIFIQINTEVFFSYS